MIAAALMPASARARRSQAKPGAIAQSSALAAQAAQP